jgi:hypothetical protein
MLRRVWRYKPVALLSICMCGAASLSSQSGVCDSGLIPTKDQWGYREVGGRCEGTYERLVSLGPLQIAAFDAGVALPELGPSLSLWWDSSPAFRSVNVRAIVLRERLYFRMDASPNRVPFVWPSAMLAHFRVRPAELAVAATATVEGVAEHVYLPIRFTEASATGGSYRLVVVPPGELSEVTVTIWPPAGRGNQPPISSRPLGLGFYPPREPFPIPIALGSRAAGYYRVRISGDFAGGGSTAADLVFLHSGPR